MTSPDPDNKNRIPESWMNVVIDTGFIGPDLTEVIYGDELCAIMPANTRWSDLLVPTIFASKNQCRKAGFDEIPFGYNEFVIGKMRARFYIWKPSDPSLKTPPFLHHEPDIPVSEETKAEYERTKPLLVRWIKRQWENRKMMKKLSGRR